MATLEAFLQTIVEDPRSEATTWPVLADWLEDHNDPRAELVRLLYQPEFHPDWTGEQRDERVRHLLASGVEAVAPTLVNSIGMRMTLIPAGLFLMGSPFGEVDDDEHPRHEVEITRPYFMGAFQVTQEEYQRVTGTNPSWFCAAGEGKEKVKKLDTKRFPVETVTWDEAATVVCCAAAPGATAGTTAARPSAAGLRPASATTTTGSASVASWTCNPLSFSERSEGAVERYSGSYPRRSLPVPTGAIPCHAALVTHGVQTRRSSSGLAAVLIE